jgi:HAD superfamily 5'-nucleotidase-like hydrolase
MKQTNYRRGVFSNRTLNLRAVRAIGYDLDYTLIHYHMEAWEQHAYSYIKERLLAEGWPVRTLEFDSELVMRGLIIDTELGNVIKANRFGYVKRAFHGTKPLDFETQRMTYQRTLVDLSSPRWVFLNTFFSISKACLFMQLVDRLDGGELPPRMDYADLYGEVRRFLDEAHMEGKLKAEISAEPERFVDLDPEMPLALLDQKEAGKKVLLITNSGWDYAAPMLSFAFDRFLPDRRTWRDVFDIAIFGARKPDFFSYRMPTFEVVSEDGLLRECRGLLKSGSAYMGANAALVELSLGLKGEEILYVGDHIFVDVNVSKSILRWRTALIIRELEEEIDVAEAFREKQEEITGLMGQKEAMESEYAALRLVLQRKLRGYGPRGEQSVGKVKRAMADVQERLIQLDARIAPLAQAASQLLNKNWGLLLRTGNDKSHLTRQIERYADIYTARVSNFLHLTPHAFLRSHRGSLPHDPGVAW